MSILSPFLTPYRAARVGFQQPVNPRALFQTFSTFREAYRISGVMPMSLTG